MIHALLVLAYVAHSLVTAMWVGAGLFMTWVARPTLAGDPALGRLGHAAHRHFEQVGWSTLVTGALVGILMREEAGRQPATLAEDLVAHWPITLGVVITLVLLGSQRLFPTLAFTQRSFRGTRWSGWLRSVAFVILLLLMALGRFQ